MPETTCCWLNPSAYSVSMFSSCASCRALKPLLILAKPPGAPPSNNLSRLMLAMTALPNSLTGIPAVSAAAANPLNPPCSISPPCMIVRFISWKLSIAPTAILNSEVPAIIVAFVS